MAEIMLLPDEMGASEISQLLHYYFRLSLSQVFIYKSQNYRLNPTFLQ